MQPQSPDHDRMNTDLFGVSAERPWDPQAKYEGALLKVYEHWCLEVSFLQHTPGSFIIFSRNSVERLSQLPANALAELGIVTAEIEDALTRSPAFRPDRFNYLQMGNALHHLHVHGIPRYASAREYGGRTWTDETYGHPPRWSEVEITRDLVARLKKDIGQGLLAAGVPCSFGNSQKLFRAPPPSEG